MPIPSVTDFENAKVDVDDLADIVNGSTTVTTRLGGDKLSVSQALSQIIVGEVTVYSAATTYTAIEQWVEFSGAIYRSLPSALPIGPEAFNAASWAVVQGVIAGGVPNETSATAFIASSSYSAEPTNTVVEVLGFANGGDGGGARWRKTGVTGLAASQSPVDLIDVKLTDANGHEWELVIGFGGINANALGAVGDLDYSVDPAVGTDNVPFFRAAMAGAQRTEGTTKVTQKEGAYLFDTDTGTVDIFEATEWCGVGGIQVRRKTSERQGTTLCIRGTTNSPFTFERGVFVHDFLIDYPDQDEDPVTPTTYPFMFLGDASNDGAKSMFENIFVDRCYQGFSTGGGTLFESVHGCFYRRYIRITDSSAFNQITNCSSSALWHVGATTNTLAFQQDNLTLFEISGGADGLQINGFTGFVAKIGINLIDSDALNFFRMGDFLLDGVMDFIVNDGTVEVRVMQFSNGLQRATNAYGSTARATSTTFNGVKNASFIDQIVQFDNVRFRSSPGGFFRVDSGLDKLTFTGCSFDDWNQNGDTGADNRSAVRMNDVDCSLNITGGEADTTNQFDAADETRIVTVSNAKRVTINSMDLNKIQKIINVNASVTLNRFTSIGCTGDDITSEVTLGAGAAITNQVLNNNIT